MTSKESAAELTASCKPCRVKKDFTWLEALVCPAAYTRPLKAASPDGPYGATSSYARINSLPQKLRANTIIASLRDAYSNLVKTKIGYNVYTVTGLKDPQKTLITGKA